MSHVIVLGCVINSKKECLRKLDDTERPLALEGN